MNNNYEDKYDINELLDNEIKNIINDKKENKEKIYDTLVLSGGSVKGVAQIGALYCLEKNGLLKNIRTIAGSSVGSMVGLLYSVGYTPIEMFKFIKLLNLNKINNMELGNIIDNYGLDDGSRIIMVLNKMIKAKDIDPDITFEKMRHKTKKELIITGSCINDKKIYYFSHKTYPNMKVLDAVRISISIPLIFTPVRFEGKIFVDGACIDNFPIHLFKDKIERVIGIYVTEKRETINEIKYIDQYLINMIQCLFEGITYRETIYHNQIIKIHCSTNQQTLKDIINLFEDGYSSAQKNISLFRNLKTYI